MRPHGKWGKLYCFAKWDPQQLKITFLKQLLNEDLWYSVRWHWNALVDTNTDDLGFDDGEYSDQDEEEPHQPTNKNKLHSGTHSGNGTTTVGDYIEQKVVTSSAGPTENVQTRRIRIQCSACNKEAAPQR